MKETNLYGKIQAISNELKAPKSQHNNFGKYNYRNVEDIFEAAKPLLQKYDLALLVSDEIVEVGGRIYLKATATITDGTDRVEVYGFAREAETKSGMDVAQITGACSSYARKYALCGLFNISGAADFDSMNNSEKNSTKNAKLDSKTFATIQQQVLGATSLDALTQLWKNLSDDYRAELKASFSQRALELTTK